MEPVEVLEDPKRTAKVLWIWGLGVNVKHIIPLTVPPPDPSILRSRSSSLEGKASLVPYNCSEL